VALTPRLLAIARRHACGSAISGRHPERCSSSAGAEHDHPVEVSGPGVERHLQRRLDQRKQRRGRRIDGGQRNQVIKARREYVLVRMEREDRLAGLRYLADAGIPIGEGVGERAAQRMDRVVPHQLGRNLAAVYQPLGATADAGEQSADADLARRRPRRWHFPDLHAPRRGVKERVGGHAGQLPAINLYKTVYLSAP
jgi:hypothetical protein